MAGNGGFGDRNGWPALGRPPRLPPVNHQNRDVSETAGRVAFDLVEAWLQQPSVTVPEPTPRHLQTMRDLILPLGTAGNLTSDAYLAALAIEHGAELCSTDNDFGRFSRLRWRNPLVG